MNTNEDTGNTAGDEMDQNYPHLRVDAAEWLSLSIKERVDWINRDRFILHPGARDALSSMKEVQSRPYCIRPACLAIIGGTNEGKTAITNRFVRDLGNAPKTIFGSNDEMPVVLVEMPPRATEPRVCLAIARALGLTGYANSKSRLVSDHVYRALVAKKVNVLILMEFQHISPLPKCEREIVLDMVKGISNQGVHVYAVGTENVRKLVAEDEQVANRMRVVNVNGFKQGTDLMDFLHSLESFYPLPKPSYLSDERMMVKIYKKTNGITGEVVTLCNAAAVWAVRNGKDCITAEAFEKAFQPVPISGLKEIAA